MKWLESENCRAKYKEIEGDWVAFVDRMHTRRTSAMVKEDAPCFAPFVHGKAEMLVLDHDNVTIEQFAKQQLTLARDGLAALVYTTFSHPKATFEGRAYARTIFRLSRAVTPEEYQEIAYYMSQVWPAPADPKCFGERQVFFLPIVPPVNATFGVRLRVFRGKPLNVDEFFSDNLRT